MCKILTAEEAPTVDHVFGHIEIHTYRADGVDVAPEMERN